MPKPEPTTEPEPTHPEPEPTTTRRTPRPTVTRTRPTTVTPSSACWPPGHCKGDTNPGASTWTATPPGHTKTRDATTAQITSSSAGQSITTGTGPTGTRTPGTGTAGTGPVSLTTVVRLLLGS